MERADLLYSGLMFAAGILSAGPRVLLTAAFVALRARTAKIRTRALLQFHLVATSLMHGAEEPTPSRSLS